MGMQGVNVVARPLDANGNPLYQYTVTFVSGAYFSGNHGNPVTGWTDLNGNPLAQWGSNDPALQGFFDLSGIPLPPGMTTANYQITFEPINPLYMLTESVGPYVDGSPTPSGTMPVLSVPNMSAGSAQSLTVTIADSAVGNPANAIASPDSPRLLPPGGLWCGRLSQVGQTDWFAFPVRAGHTFTIVTQALNEAGLPTETKALPAIGVWDAFKPVSATSLNWAPALNGYATGETWLQVTASADDIVRLGIADMRGDGRPDYAYNGWVLYADTVQPPRLPVSGGPIVIHGMGFRPSDTVLIGGQKAIVTSISPNEITAIAPAAAPGDLPARSTSRSTICPCSMRWRSSPAASATTAATGDSLTLNTAPANTVPIGVPIPFTVTALGPDLTPAGGVTVTFSVVSGNATLACGAAMCSAAATGDGIATMNITAPSSGASVVTASLTNGASLQAHFSGGTPPTLAALTPDPLRSLPAPLSTGPRRPWHSPQRLTRRRSDRRLAIQREQHHRFGAHPHLQPAQMASHPNPLLSVRSPKASRPPQLPASMAPANASTLSSSVRDPEFAWLEAVSGTAQTLSASGTPGLVTLRVRDMNGNPMAGGTVTLYQSLYAWTATLPSRTDDAPRRPCSPPGHDCYSPPSTAPSPSFRRPSPGSPPTSLPWPSPATQALCPSPSSSIRNHQTPRGTWANICHPRALLGHHITRARLQ